MISYNPFWKTLKNSNESTYTLINKHHISSSTIDRLRKNQAITTTTMNDLCRVLNCKVEDIAVYVSSDEDQFLFSGGAFFSVQLVFLLYPIYRETSSIFFIHNRLLNILTVFCVHKKADTHACSRHDVRFFISFLYSFNFLLSRLKNILFRILHITHCLNQ